MTHGFPLEFFCFVFSSAWMSGTKERADNYLPMRWLTVQEGLVNADLAQDQP
jgi:hypothetical protein